MQYNHGSIATGGANVKMTNTKSPGHFWPGLCLVSCLICLRLELGLEVGDGVFEGVYRTFGQCLVAGDGFRDSRLAVGQKRLELGLEAADGLDRDVV